MERLSTVQEKFILHWGEMGTRWGINRTVAQIHALLYLSAEPLHAEEIARLLSVARSNVSSSLRELQGWGIVRIAHVLGDRRDHFESLKDVWQMFQIIVEERKRREVDPTIAMLKGGEAEAPVEETTEPPGVEMTPFFVRRFQSLQKGLSLMKIAITGATGFVGRYLARALSYQGHQLALIARGVDGRDRTVRRIHGAEFHAASITDEDALSQVFAGCDA